MVGQIENETTQDDLEGGNPPLGLSRSKAHNPTEGIWTPVIRKGLAVTLWGIALAAIGGDLHGPPFHQRPKQRILARVSTWGRTSRMVSDERQPGRAPRHSSPRRSSEPRAGCVRTDGQRSEFGYRIRTFRQQTSGASQAWWRGIARRQSRSQSCNAERSPNTPGHRPKTRRKYHRPARAFGRIQEVVGVTSSERHRRQEPAQTRTQGNPGPAGNRRATTDTPRREHHTIQSIRAEPTMNDVTLRHSHDERSWSKLQTVVRDVR